MNTKLGIFVLVLALLIAAISAQVSDVNDNLELNRVLAEVRAEKPIQGHSDEHERCSQLAKMLADGKDVSPLMHVDIFQLSYKAGEFPLSGVFTGKWGLTEFKRRFGLVLDVEPSKTKAEYIGHSDLHRYCVIKTQLTFKFRRTGAILENSPHMIVAKSSPLGKYMAARIYDSSPETTHGIQYAYHFQGERNAWTLGSKIYAHGYNSTEVQDMFTSDSTISIVQNGFGYGHDWSFKGTKALQELADLVDKHVHPPCPHGSSDTGTSCSRRSMADMLSETLINDDTMPDVWDNSSLSSNIEKNECSSDSLIDSMRALEEKNNQITYRHHHHHHHRHHHDWFPLPIAHTGTWCDFEHEHSQTEVAYMCFLPYVRSWLRKVLPHCLIGQLYLRAPTVRVVYKWTADDKVDSITITLNQPTPIHGRWRGHKEDDSEDKSGHAMLSFMGSSPAYMSLSDPRLTLDKENNRYIFDSDVVVPKPQPESNNLVNYYVWTHPYLGTSFYYPMTPRSSSSSAAAYNSASSPYNSRTAVASTAASPSTEENNEESTAGSASAAATTTESSQPARHNVRRRLHSIRRRNTRSRESD